MSLFDFYLIFEVFGLEVLQDLPRAVSVCGYGIDQLSCRFSFSIFDLCQEIRIISHPNP